MNTESWTAIFDRTSLAQQFPLISTFLIFELFTFIGLPLVFLIFKNFSDKGFPFAKIAALVIVAYIAWLGSSLNILQFTRPTLLAIVFVLSVVSLIYIIKNWEELKDFLNQKWKLLLFEEIFFWTFFILFLLIRNGNPDLWHPAMGGEKPMDFAFLNAIIKTKTFPPYDPWFAGGVINYYYFGQFLIATLIKITAIIPSIFYNIALAFLFAQSAMGAFSIIFKLTKSSIFGFLGSIFLIIIGNLAQIPLIIDSFSSTLPINAWYWTATRVMPNYEINEFPFFSFLYADLHSHIIALPLALLIIGFCINLIQEKFSFGLSFLLRLGLLSLFLGILRITNLWDFPSYLLFSVFSLILFFFYKKKIQVLNLVKAIISIAGIVILSNLLVFPFLTDYKTGPLGLGLYQGDETQIKDYLYIHGFFLFVLISFFFSTIRIKLFHTSGKLFIAIFFFSFFLVLSFLKLWFILFLSFLFFLGIQAFLSIGNQKQELKKIFPLILSLFAIFLTLVPDLIDFKLGLGRMNTVFKFYFQAWVFYALASASCLPFIFLKLKTTHNIFRFIWLLSFLLLLASSLAYTFTATNAKIRDRMNNLTPNTLDGMEYMKDSYYFDQNKRFDLMWDYQAINWILDNISGTPVILEGNAPIYRWGSRVSIYTGLPTVIGWDWHEKAHRSYLDPYDIDVRVNDVKRLYETNSFVEFWQLVNKYNIEYIYVGELERAYYGEKSLADFEKLTPNIFKTIYKNPGVTIHKITR